MKFVVHLLLQCIVFWTTQVSAIGWEQPLFTTPAFTEGVSHRQNVCDRYHAVQNGTATLRNALEGFELRMAQYPSPFFQLDVSTGGIDPTYPGIIAILMDELAMRAGFTWRNSWGLLPDNPTDFNKTWSDLLVWTVETYDMCGDWFAKSAERLERNVARIEGWYDSDVVLIAKMAPVDPEKGGGEELNLWNWLLPFTVEVWYLVLATIFFSGGVHMWLEYMSDERDERSYRRWASDSLYQSILNFT